MKKEFKQGDEVFYKNKKAVFVSYLPTNEAAIEVFSSFGDGDDYDVFQDTFVVPSTKLTDKQILNNEAFDSLERELSSKRISETSKINSEIRELQAAKNSIEKQMKKYEGLSYLLDYLNGVAVYAVAESHYAHEVIELNKFMTNDEPYRRKLRSFSIQRDRDAINNYGEYAFYASRYDSYSGNDVDKCHLFKTKEEAVVKLIEVMKKHPSHVTASKLEHYEIKDETLWKIVKDREAELAAKRQKEILEKENELARLKAVN